MHIPSDTEKPFPSAIPRPGKIIKMDVSTAWKGDSVLRFGVICGIGFDASICHEALASPIKDALNGVTSGS